MQGKPTRLLAGRHLAVEAYLAGIAVDRVGLKEGIEMLEGIEVAG